MADMDNSINSNSNKKWLNTKQAIEYTGLSRKVFYSLLRQGSVPYYRFGREYRFTTEDLDEWIERQRVEAKTE